MTRNIDVSISSVHGFFHEGFVDSSVTHLQQNRSVGWKNGAKLQLGYVNHPGSPDHDVILMFLLRVIARTIVARGFFSTRDIVYFVPSTSTGPTQLSTEVFIKIFGLFINVLHGLGLCRTMPLRKIPSFRTDRTSICVSGTSGPPSPQHV